MQEGKIIAPRQVEAELEKRQKSISQMHVWLWDHRYPFRDMDDSQLKAAKRIVNAYPCLRHDPEPRGDPKLMTRYGPWHYRLDPRTQAKHAAEQAPAEDPRRVRRALCRLRFTAGVPAPWRLRRAGSVRLVTPGVRG